MYKRSLVAVAILGLLALLAGCRAKTQSQEANAERGSSANPGALVPAPEAASPETAGPPLSNANISVSVLPSIAVVPAGTTMKFQSQVNGSTRNPAVGWQVDGIQGGDGRVGTISSSGTYTAPKSVDSQLAVKITAVSVADPARSGFATATVIPPNSVLVQISPISAIMELRGSKQFFAKVVNSSDGAVVWQVNGITGGNAEVGTISGAGMYTALAKMLTPPEVTVTAVPHADPAKPTSVKIRLQPKVDAGAYNGI